MSDLLTPDESAPHGLNGLEADYGDDWAVFRFGGARVEFTRIKAGKDDAITARCRVNWTVGPYAGYLHGPAKINLLNERALSKSVAVHCAQQIPEEEWTDRHWWKLFAAVKALTVDRFERGDPLVPIIEVPSSEARWLIAPLLDDDVTVMAAAPGSAKSFLGVAAALSVATDAPLLNNKPRTVGPVAYLDWETGPASQTGRFRAMARGHDLKVPAHVLYRREVKPLAATAKDYAREFRERGVVFCVIDSQGPASSGSMVDDEPVRAFYHGVRELAVPTLVITQVNAEAMRHGASRPFGSVYTDYAARRIWTMKHKPQQNGDTLLAQWTLTKANNDRQGNRLAYRWTFRQQRDTLVYDEIRVECVDPFEEKPDTYEDAPLADQIVAHLSVVAAATTAELAEALDRSAAQVRARCNELAKRSMLLKDGSRWRSVFKAPAENPWSSA